MKTRHIVRAHWRKLPDGRSIWIDQHVKGDPSQPIVIRDTNLCEGIEPDNKETDSE